MAVRSISQPEAQTHRCFSGRPASLHRYLLCSAASGDAVAPAVNPSFSAGRTTSLTLAFPQRRPTRRRSALLLSG